MATDFAGGAMSILGPNKESVPKRMPDLSLGTELNKILGGAQTYLPQMQDLMLGQYWQANPLLKSLLEQTNSAVSGDLALGGQMSPVEVRRSVQATRAPQSAAGFGQSSRRDRFEEAVQLATSGEALRQKRLENAYQLLGINRGAVPDYGPNLFSSIYGTSEDITSANWNRGIDERTGAQNRNAAEVAGFRKFVGDIIGSVAGGAGKGAAGCWVAREVYGEENPAWKMFRFWLYTQAPAWFKKLYLRHGPRFARWIHNKPRLKAVIRKWMDARIATLNSALRTPHSALEYAN